MKNNYNYTPVPLLLRAVKFVTVPMFNSGGTCSEYHLFYAYNRTCQIPFTDQLVNWYQARRLAVHSFP